MDIFDLIWAVIVWLARIVVSVFILFAVAMVVFAISQGEWFLSLVYIVAVFGLIWGFRKYLVIEKSKKKRKTGSL